ncbi:uncharacterized protein EKO05_0006180 [Ascochyta rabiei]|uniref:uncharacterized protein n=1 Tax=Didymella rabiei TaxID=5454 RepID=UPI002201202F|nr:uncharacterized protein EKO05_0006180 [Ascochyta rabiei]UPX15741.1 hypothetical protein EKO05_0006180 [Ascochyta rabiei]
MTCKWFCWLCRRYSLGVVFVEDFASAHHASDAIRELHSLLLRSLLIGYLWTSKTSGTEIAAGFSGDGGGIFVTSQF